MKFRELMESTTEYVDNRLTTLFKKQGLTPKIKKEIGYTKYSFENNVDIINDGVGISVKRKGKEIEYFDKPKMDYTKAIAKALDAINMNESKINKKNWEVLKDFMRKQSGFKSWEFEGDYEILIIGFKDNASAIKAYKASTSSTEISVFGSVEVKNGKITVKLNNDAMNAMEETSEDKKTQKDGEENKKINEAHATQDEIISALKELKGVEPEALRVALMNRARTNKDGRWQAEYFYGSKKAESKADQQRIVNFMMTMDNWCTEEEVLEAILKFQKEK